MTRLEAECCGIYRRKLRKIVVYKEDEVKWFSGLYYLVIIFCHELGHHTQYQERSFKKKNWRCYPFQTLLDWEWEADRRGFEFAKKHFLDMTFRRWDFWSYRNKKEKRFLYNYQLGGNVEELYEFR